MAGLEGGFWVGYVAYFDVTDVEFNSRSAIFLPQPSPCRISLLHPAQETRKFCPIPCGCSRTARVSPDPRTGQRKLQHLRKAWDAKSGLFANNKWDGSDPRDPWRQQGGDKTAKTDFGQNSSLGSRGRQREQRLTITSLKDKNYCNLAYLYSTLPRRSGSLAPSPAQLLEGFKGHP